MDQSLTIDAAAGARPPNIALRTAAAAFAISAATIAGAWYFQLVVKLAPCPLCLEERIPYYVIIPVALLVVVLARGQVPRWLITAGFAIVAVAALCGVALGAYHAGIEWRFWPGPTDCTGTLTDLKSQGPLLNQLQSFNVVRCDEAAWRLFGISLAGYNALISALLAAIAIGGLLLRRRSPR